MACAALMGLAANERATAASFASWSASSLGDGSLGTATLVAPVSGITSIISGNGSNLGTKTVGGIKGLGVTNGKVNNEIDVAKESITVTFSAPTTLASLTLGALYQPGEFGDTVFEKARITVNGLVSYYLQVTGNTSASWTGNGSVVNLALATEPNGGAFKILNPFSTAVSSLTFSAVLVGDGTAKDSDFTLVSLEGSRNSVPEPTSAAASLGILLVGAGLSFLKNKR
jgi:hypothetical protein